VNDPRANMEGNNLLGMGAPIADWTKAPGRVLGFWVALAGLILAVFFPLPSMLVASVGLFCTMQAFRVIPAGARGRGLTIAALVIAAATIAVIVLQFVIAAMR